MKMLTNEKGFTLIELVLIIVVLGVLSAVATMQFGNVIGDSKDAAVQGIAGSVNAQLAVAVNDIKALPTVGADAGTCITGTNADTDFGDRVRSCITVASGVTISAIHTGDTAFHICTGAACSTASPPVCDSTTERFLTVTYTAASGALAITNPANCA